VNRLIVSRIFSEKRERIEHMSSQYRDSQAVSAAAREGLIVEVYIELIQ
jgi:hypothetical protein